MIILITAMIRYKRHFLITLLIIGATLKPGFAKPITFNISEQNAKDQIHFESKAPAEYINGVTDQVLGTVTLDAAQADLGLKATISVPVSSMRTDVPMRDQHMKSAEWLDPDHFPLIHFDLGVVNKTKIISKGNNVWFVRATGEFSMKGRTQIVSVPVTLRIENNGGVSQVHIEGRFSLRLADFGIYGPAGIQMIGLKVSPNIAVSFHLVGVADKGWDTLVPKYSHPHRKLKK